MGSTEQLSSALAGRYAVEREIGRGGMAVVYAARDLRHGRLVALKVLNPELGAVIGPERFLSEIHVTAALQHPHLLPLFDSGEAEGLLYYTMPLVDGESLRARLDREIQLPVAEAVHIAAAVASALDYAHRRGVVHRDLKPENILLQDGQPLIADFGIALALSKAGGARMTQTGVALGTPHYMSPEQAAGDRAIDGRTDIYSLGAVLYEMLTGEPPHTGSNAQAVIARVLTEVPRSPRAIRASVPESLEAAVSRALEKLPADRWPTARAFADALDATGAGGPATGGAPTRSVLSLGRRPGRTRAAVRGAFGLLPWALALLGLTTAGALWRRTRLLATPAPVRFTLALPPGQRLTGDRDATISPDGRTIAYVAVENGTRQLYIRPLDKLEARALAGTDGAARPFFSPDGQWVAYDTPDGVVKKVPVAGGRPAALSSAAFGGGAGGVGRTWVTSDAILVGMRTQWYGLSKFPAGGGVLRPLTTPDTAAGEWMHHNPVALADGETVLFTDVEQPGRAAAGDYIGVASLSSGRHVRLDLPGGIPMGVWNGLLIYRADDGAIMAVPFDVTRRRVRGAPVRVDDELAGGSAARASAHLAQDGTLLYTRAQPATSAVYVDVGGQTQPSTLLTDVRDLTFPRVSPDGRRVAFTVTGESADVWVYDLAARTFSRLTTTGRNALCGWTPDGRRLVFSSIRGGGRGGLWWQLADGSAPAERVPRVPSNVPVADATLSRDGLTLLYVTPGPQGTGSSLWTMAMRGDSTPRPFVDDGFSARQARWSPDGRSVAFVSNVSGRDEVYVQPFPGPGARVQVSADGGSEPVWAPDGRRLFYRAGTRLLAASVSAAPALSVTGRAVVANAADTKASGVRADYDVTPDGARLVMLQSARGDAPQLVVVLNWAAAIATKLGR